MNESEYQYWRETGWRRPLHADEEARLQSYLASHPEARTDWESEVGLSQWLGQLPDAPLPSNFTAQVLQAVDREEAAARRRVSLGERWAQLVRRAVPRLAWACVILALAILGIRQHQIYTHDKMAKGLIQVTEAADLKDPAVFKDFEAILRLGQMPPPADVELDVALNELSK